eukprot:115337_1
MAAQNMMTLTDEEMNIILLLRQSSQSTQQAVYTLLNATANNNNDPEKSKEISHGSKRNQSNYTNTNHDLQIALELSNQYQSRPHVGMNLNKSDRDLQFALRLSYQHQSRPSPQGARIAETQQQDAHSHGVENKAQEDFDEELLKNMFDIFDMGLQQRSRRRSEPTQRINCAICLQQCQRHERKRVLPCMHVFHKDCIDAWTNTHRTCPICRTNV